MPTSRVIVVVFFFLFFMSHANADGTIAIALSDEQSKPVISNIDGVPEGLLFDVAVVLDQLSTAVSFEYLTFPWRRAQHMVENGSQDAFITFPSEQRKEYALFTRSPVIDIDYGVLVFNKDNPNKQAIINSTSFEDIKHLTFITSSGSEWEDETIPESFNRIYATDVDVVLHYAFGRDLGDFFLMSIEELKYISKRLGYKDQYEYKSVNYIPNMKIPFHFGISKLHPDSKNIISHLDQVMKSEDFQNKAREVVKTYR